jgi:putative ABC transport system ATP-binding protein
VQPWLDMVITTLGLTDRLQHRPSELSGGQQQRVAVGRALASRPEIIFGDEPTGNLDSRSSGEVMGILRRSVDELGQTVVMVTHDARAASYADRVLFLADGRIVDELRAPTAETVLDRMKELER